jgi:hypothetical protein
MDANQNGFYTDTGQIASPDTAHDVAHLLNQGAPGSIKAAEDRERELLRIHESGKTEEQLKYGELMDQLAEKYPHAFVDITGRDSIRMMMLIPGHLEGMARGGLTPENALIYTEFGLLEVAAEDKNRDIELNALLMDGKVDMSAILDSVRNNPLTQSVIWEKVGNYSTPSSGGEELRFLVKGRNLFSWISFRGFPSVLREMHETVNELERERKKIKKPNLTVSELISRL